MNDLNSQKDISKEEPFDVCNVVIREARREDEQELRACDNVIASSFSALVGFQVPVTNAITMRKYYKEIYVAEYVSGTEKEKKENEIIGCVVANHWGCIRCIGPFCVLPKYWNKKVGSLLIKHLIKSTPKYITRDILGTFAANFQTKFYRKFGFESRFLLYVLSINISDFIKNKIKINVNDCQLLTINEYSLMTMKHPKWNVNLLKQCLQLCDNAYNGLNPMDDVKYILDKKIEFNGKMFILFDVKNLLVKGFCVCVYHGKPQSQSILRTKFGIAENVTYLEIMIVEMMKCISIEKDTSNVEQLWVGINTQNVQAFDMFTNKLKFNYKVENANVCMGRKTAISNSNDKSDDFCNDYYDDYHGTDSCILTFSGA